MLLTWLWLRLLVLLLPLEGERITIFLSGKQLQDWLDNVRKRDAYPVFGILMAHRSDREVAKIVNSVDYRGDIADISGGECCFLYFHEENSNDITKNLYVEHVKQVYEISALLRIERRKFPCFIFFNRLSPDNSVIISLQGMPADEVIRETSRIFDYVRRVCKEQQVSAFEALEKYEKAQKVKFGVNVGKEVILSVAIRGGVEFIKSTLGL